MRSGIFFLLACAVLPAQSNQVPDPVRPNLLQQAIDSFKARTGSLGMRTDSPAGAVSKPAPLAWHGRIFWNLRNDIFDAVPHEVTQTGGDKGILRRNQYGFSLSGPVLIPKIFHGRNRTFFTVTYEGVREKQGRSFLETIAARPERTGDFSQTVDKAGRPLSIYDPDSTRPNPAFDPSRGVSAGNLQYLRDVFPNNRIPAFRLDPVALDALRHYPEPNVSIGPYFQNNYSIYTPERNEADGFRAQIDHNVSDRQRVAVGLNISNGFLGAAQVYNSIASPSDADRRERTRELSLSHTYTVSANSVNTFRAQLGNSVSRSVGTSGAAASPFPSFSFSPYLGMGRTDPISRTSGTSFEFENGFSLRRGSHRIRIAGTANWNLDNDYEPRYPAGFFSFRNGLTGLPGIVNTGHSYATFLLGLADRAEQTLVLHPSYWRQLEWQSGLQDEWQVRSGLTLSLGLDLRFAYARSEKYHRQSTVDLDAVNPVNGKPGALVFANRDGRGRRLQPTRHLLLPQFGVAWSPAASSRTVFRFGYTRGAEGFRAPGGHWGTQGFNGIATFFTQNEQLQPAVVLRNGLPDESAKLPNLRPEAANDTDAYLLVLPDRAPTSNTYKASLEHQLTSTLLLRAGAEYTRGWNQEADNAASPNAIPLEALQYRDLLYDEAFNQSLRPYPHYRRFATDDANIGEYKGTVLDVSVGKRTSQGLSLQFEYKFTRRMDNYDDQVQDSYHIEKEWALSENPPHEITLQYLYELPFGRSKPYLTTGLPATLFGGWSISGATSFSSGEPLQLRARFNNTGGVVRDLYVNAVPGEDPQTGDRGPARWFNPNAFVNPPDFTIGNISRRHPSLRYPSSQNHDVALSKRFRLSSDREVEFVGTALNFLNHANWNDPDAEIGSRESPNANAGRIIGSRGGRVIQLGLRFSF